MDPISDYSDSPLEEKSLRSQIENLSSEEKVGLTVAVSVNVIAFSKEPFNEPWKDISNEEPRILTDLDEVSQIVSSFIENPDLCRVYNDKEGKEIWERVDIEGKVENRVITEYPLSKILRTYIREMRDPESVLLVKYMNSEGKERIVDLSKASIDDIPTEPVAIFRIRNIKDDVVNEILGEVGDYLTKDQESALRSNLSNEHTAYLGEVANLKNEGLFLLSALKASISSFKPFPKQLVYLTKPGTSIEDSNRESNPISRIIKGVYKTFSLVEEKQVYENELGEKSILYIYKINSPESE